jgi:CheY-like chemotaxis protein
MSNAEVGRLLIADDDPSLIEAYVLFFGACGYIIQTAPHGVAALAAYRNWDPDVVMLDIQMPHMGGYAVAREIRRMGGGSWPLLLAVTARCAASDRAQSLEAGFDHHFGKPAELELILATIAARPSR